MRCRGRRHCGSGSRLHPAQTLVDIQVEIPLTLAHGIHSVFLQLQLAVQALLAGASADQQSAWLPKIAAGAVATTALMESDGDWALDRPTARAELTEGRARLCGAKSFVLDAATAEAILGRFTEVVIAPEVEPAAAEVLATKKDLRVLATGPMPDPERLNATAANPAAAIRRSSSGKNAQSMKPRCSADEALM